MKALDDPETGLPYILGVRMRKVKEVRDQVLADTQEFREVRPEGKSPKDPSPLQVKEVTVNGRRYIVCLNSKEARKDQADREAILTSLEEQLKKGATSLVGNRGFRRYLKSEKGTFIGSGQEISQDQRPGSRPRHREGGGMRRPGANMTQEILPRELFSVCG
jgi:hypothetical protein